MAFTRIIGQKELKLKLGSMMTGESSQSFLITGVQGIGKHLVGEELSKALLCLHPSSDGACDECPNCKYFDAKSHPDMKRIEALKGKKSIRIADLRSEVITDSSVAAQLSSRKVYLINADQLNEDSQNCLLKSLEEPPKGVTFILLCSDASKLLGTILSRVLELRLAPYSTDDIKKILLQSEKGKELDDGKLSFYSSFSGLVPGKALSLLDDEVFSESREYIFDTIMKMPTMSVTDVLIDVYSYFDKNKDVIGELLLLMEWTLGDIGTMLASSGEGNIKNADKTKELKDFIAQNSNVILINISNAVNAINEFARGLRVNASFDGACSSMLLKIYKELKR